MFFQNLSYKVGIGINHALTQHFGVIELVGSNCSADRVRMKAEFSCNGSDFPVFCIKQATDTGICFQVDH